MYKMTDIEFESKLNLDENRRKSPQEYKTARAIPRIEQFKKVEKDNNPIAQIVSNLRTNAQFDENFNTLSILNDDNVIIDIDINKNFLCDIELFNWKGISKNFHKSIIGRIQLPTVYKYYTIHLCKQLGNNLNLFTDTFTEEPTWEFSQNIIKKYSKPGNDIILIDIPISMKTINTDTLSIYPFCVIKSKKNTTTCYYSNKILTKDKRYSIINNYYLMDSNGHFTFTFIDHEKKIIDHYDSSISNTDKNSVSIIFNVLLRLFDGYTINKFWNNKGLQYTETIEQDEEGFCVIWGHMMMHLKLLNIETPISELEDSFIKQCANKNLSLYEVMLNYAYNMERIIPKYNTKRN
jgi:hypothetical protein